MTGMLTGFALQHEAERQSAYILIRDTFGVEAWFEDGWDTMRGDVALEWAWKTVSVYKRRYPNGM